MSNATLPFEWVFETINKRIGPPYSLNIADLFIVVPHAEEAEFDYELSTAWKNKKFAEGNDLNRDYPNLATLMNSSNKKITIKVFFVHPSRCIKPLILWSKKYKYPKVGLRSKQLVTLN